MLLALDWFLVCLLLLVTISYSIITVNARVVPAPKRHVRLNADLRTMDVQTPVAPMWWDKTEGAYMVSLIVGAGVVELVLDTGSSNLSVKGTGCKWRQCNGDACEVTSCPCGMQSNGKPRTDCTEHYYRPTGPRLAPGERGAGTLTTMTYGSQTDTVSHYLDTVAMPLTTSAVSCHTLSAAPPSTVDARMGSRVEIGNLVIHRVSHIDGSSSSNLLGLARPYGKSRDGTRAVLDALLDATKIWSAVLYPTGGWLAMGALPCYRPHYIPLLTPPAFANFLTRFYLVDVVSIAVGPSLHALTPLTYFPRYCLIDTGTTSTYGSPKFGAALDAAGYMDTKSIVQIKLGSTSPFTLTYTPTDLQDPDYPGQSVIAAWPGRTLTDYTQLFPDSDGGVLLMGAVMMFGFYWEFDLHHSRLGILDMRV